MSTVALLVGGNEDVLRSLRSDLFDEFDIEVRNHWVNARQFCPMPPRGTDAILVLSDFCSHAMSREARQLARTCGVRFVSIGRKKSAWLTALMNCGFVHRSRFAAKKGESMEEKKTAPVTMNGVLASKPFKGLEGISLPTGAMAARELPKPVPSIEHAAIIPMPRLWTEDDMATVARLAESFKASNGSAGLAADGDRFVMQNWKESGAFRTASVLRLRVDAIRFVVKVPMDCITALTRASTIVRRAKRAYIKNESEILKKKPRAEWPPWISNEAAVKLVGGTNRLPRPPMMMRSLGMIVYDRARVVELLERFDERGVTTDFAGPGMTAFEWERRILETLAARGPSSRNAFKMSGIKEGSTAKQALDGLLRSERIIGSQWRGGIFYRLPEHAWPLPPRKMPPRQARVKPPSIPPDAAERLAALRAQKSTPVVPSPVPVPVVAAPVDALRELRADVYRAMRAGEITAKDAAELLRQLASGA